MIEKGNNNEFIHFNIIKISPFFFFKKKKVNIQKIKKKKERKVKELEK